MTAWLVAATVAAFAFWRLRRWRTWAGELRAHLEAMRRRSGSALPPQGPSSSATQGLRDSLAQFAEESWALVDETRDESRQLRAVIAGMFEGVLVIDADGMVLLTNPRIEELLEMAADEPYVGLPFASICRHPDLHELLRLVMSGVEWDRSQVQEVSLGAARDVTLRVTASPLSMDGGMRHAYVLVFHDISAIRQLERVRRDFVANVSHELRTPLSAIGGYTETLLSGALDEPDRARRFLEIIARHSDRLGRLVDDLLVLSDLELGRTELQRASQNIPRVVEATFETLRAKAEQAGVTLESTVMDDVPPIDADGDRVEQAFLNLVDNAIKYTPSGGHVHVSASTVADGDGPEGAAVAGRGGKFVEIAVSDTGVGVPPDDLSRLTERFYRVDKARSRELGGTGLGLAIVKHIVQAHGGWMRIESELHRGTTVRLYLPVFAGRSDGAEGTRI